MFSLETSSTDNPWRISYDAVDQLIAATSLTRRQHVLVAGTGAMGLLVGLCRRDFLSVTCPVPGARLTGEPAADVVLILGFPSVPHLRALVLETLPALRPGGRIGIVMGEDATPEDVPRIRRLLMRAGLVRIGLARPRDGGGCVIHAHRAEPALRVAALRVAA